MTPQGEGGAHVVVGLDAIYELALETRDAVRDVRAKLDDVADDSKDHETRIRALEHKVWWASGIAAAAGYTASQVLPLIG